jgi:ABC-type nitrate/sulfonate/bicarbonate transport system permease component
MDFSPKKAQTWWFPYDRSLVSVMEKAVAAFHGAGLGARLGALWGLRKDWRRILATAPLFNYVRALPRIFKK